MDISVVYGLVVFLFAILSAKWSLELGMSQVAQLGVFVAGAIAGPLILLAM